MIFSPPAPAGIDGDGADPKSALLRDIYHRLRTMVSLSPPQFELSAMTHTAITLPWQLWKVGYFSFTYVFTGNLIDVWSSASGPETSSYDDRFPATDVVSPVLAVGHSDDSSSSDADLAATVAVGVVHAVRDGDHAASTFFKASDFLSYIPSPNIVLTSLAVLQHLAHRHTLPLWSSPPPLESDALSERPHPKP
ncbi:hypothetical protein B0H13DRAFT_2656588 [Mycena leptocephala]|nr:hypothetical protein B0H13DRAFT_2656588 [Mycena leptocephala]